MTAWGGTERRPFDGSSRAAELSLLVFVLIDDTHRDCFAGRRNRDAPEMYRDSRPRKARSPATMAPHKYPMISMPEAIDIVLSRAAPLEEESLPFADAVGRVLASEVTAPRPHPRAR